LLLSLLVLLALLVAATAAQAAFSPLGTLSGAGQNASRVEIAVSPSGDAAFVWRRFDGTSATCCTRIEARFRSASGTLGPVLTLSDASQNADHPPQVGIDASGRAVFVWRRFDGTGPECCARIQTRARTAAGALTATKNVSASGQNATAPQVAVEPDGDALIAWSRFDATDPGCCERIQMRARSPAGVLGSISTLSRAGHHSDDPEVAVDPDGDAVFIWERFVPTSPGCCKLIEARARSAAGTLSATQPLSALSVNAGDPRIRMDSSGGAVFSWLRSDQSSPGCCNRAQTRSRSPTGTLSAIQTISAAGQNAADGEVGVDASGNAILAWTLPDGTSPPGCCDIVQYRTRTAAGVLSTTKVLSVAGQNAAGSNLAVDENGNAVFAWARGDGTSPPDCCNRIQVRTRSAAGVLGAVQTLSAAGENAARPSIGLDPDGGANPNSPDGILAWPRFDGTAPPDCCNRIQAAIQVASP
jgi:hypothetical protein